MAVKLRVFVRFLNYPYHAKITHKRVILTLVVPLSLIAHYQLSSYRSVVKAFMHAWVVGLIF